MKTKWLPIGLLCLLSLGIKAQESDAIALESGKANRLFQQADSSLQRGNYVNAVLYFEESVGIFSQLLGKEHKRLGRIYRLVAERLSDAGHVREAVPYCLKAIEVQESQPQADFQELGKLYLAAAQLYHHQLMNGSALDFYQKAERTYAAIPQTSPSFLADLRLVRANLLFEIGHYEQAAQLFRQAADFIVNETGTELNHNLAVIYGNIGQAYLQTDSLDLAVDHLQKAVTLNERLFGQPTEDIAQLYTAISSIYFGKLHLDSAQHYALKTLATYDQLAGKNEGQAIRFLEMFCKGLINMQVYATAAIWHKIYLDRLEKSGQLSDDYFLVRCLRTAELFSKEWQFNEAMDFYYRALEYAEKQYGKTDFRVANLAFSMAIDYEKLKDHPMAREFYLKALDLQQLQVPADTSMLMTCSIKVGDMFVLEKKYDLANCYYKKAATYIEGINNKKVGLYHKIAINHYSLGAFHKAEKYVDQEIKFYQERYHGDHVNMPVSLLLRGSIAASLEEPATAKQYFKQALVLDSHIFNYETALSREASQQMASLLYKEGKNREAARYLEKAMRD